VLNEFAPRSPTVGNISLHCRLCDCMKLSIRYSISDNGSMSATLYHFHSKLHAPQRDQASRCTTLETRMVDRRTWKATHNSCDGRAT